MRTLKVLSLVLALVLCFGLVGTAFAAPANYKGYTDAEQIGAAYVEAADVMKGIGVIEGKTDTTVDPTGSFTREQAAKIIAYMLVGPAAAEKLSATAAPFADVAADRWSAGFISYCAEQGIISGIGDGKFDPTGTLTGYQFAKMLLAAVGYNANGEYEGASWSINVAKDAIQKGVFDGDLAAATNQPIQRQQAMLMAFNTLNYIPRVTYSDLLKQYVAYGTGLLGTAVTPSYLSDNFGLWNFFAPTATGAAGHQWRVGAKVASDVYLDGTIEGTETALGALTEAAINAKYAMDPAGINCIVNGTSLPSPLSGTPTNKPWAFIDGATAQFIDSDEDGLVDEVVITFEYLAYVKDVTATAITLNVFDSPLGTDTNAVTGGTANTLPAAQYAALGLAKGDFAIVIPSFAAPGTFISVVKAAPVTAKVTEYATAVNSITFGGQKYAMAAQADLIPATFASNTIDFSADYNIFLNSNGRPLGIVLASAPVAVTPNFLFVTASQSAAAAGSDLLTAAAPAQFKVKGVLLDGTTKVFDMAIDKNKVMIDGTATAVTTAVDPLTKNTVYAYTLNDKGELASVQAMTNGVAYLGYTPIWTTTATDVVTVNAGNAQVKLNGAVMPGVYATTSTALVVGGKTVTEYAGYVNFPGTAALPKAFEVGTGAGKCAALVGVTKGNFINNILVVDQAATAPITPPVVAVYTGNSTQRANAAGVDTTYYEFQKADGTKEFYPVTGTAPTVKTVYTLAINAGVATLTAAGTTAVVDEKTDTYVVIGGAVYYTTGDVALDISAPAAAMWKNASFVKGDAVTIIVTNGQITAAFITAHA